MRLARWEPSASPSKHGEVAEEYLPGLSQFGFAQLLEVELARLLRLIIELGRVVAVILRVILAVSVQHEFGGEALARDDVLLSAAVYRLACRVGPDGLIATAFNLLHDPPSPPLFSLLFLGFDDAVADHAVLDARIALHQALGHAIVRDFVNALLCLKELLLDYVRYL